MVSKIWAESPPNAQVSDNEMQIGGSQRRSTKDKPIIGPIHSIPNLNQPNAYKITEQIYILNLQPHVRYINNLPDRNFHQPNPSHLPDTIQLNLNQPHWKQFEAKERKKRPPFDPQSPLRGVSEN
jgi:hypothetical protein